MKKTILAIIGALISISSSAQTLSLDECVALALENNSQVHIARYNLDASKETSREAFTKYFPSISLSGIAFRANRGMLQHSFYLPLSQLPLGLPDMDFNLQLIKKGSVAGLNLMQPVFLGGRIVNGNKLAHVGEEVSKLQQRQTNDEVRKNVEQYYWQLVTLHSKHRTLDQAIAMLDTLSLQVQNYVEAGLTTTNDLLEVNLKRNEMMAARAELDNGIAVLRMLLSQYIGKGTTGSVDVNTQIPMDKLPAFPHDIFRTPEDCLANTVGYNLLNQNIRAKELEHKIAVGSNLPMIAVGAGCNYEHLMEQSHTFANVYVTVSIPLTDWWGGAHNIKKKSIETKIARMQLEDNSQLLMIAMTNSWNDLTTAYTQICIAYESIAQASENLRLNQNFYQAGTITITDLLNAETLMRTAQNKYVDAYGAFQIKQLSYLQATGR